MGEQGLAATLRQVRSRLAAAGIPNAEIDARLLVEHFSGATQTDLIVAPERTLSPDVIDAIEAAVARRLSREPVHRILGFREFYGLELALSQETLEPRPDTEILVDAVLPFVRQVVENKGICSILDLGTGSGAIALALLKQVPEAVATGVDVSPQALEVARQNAARHGLSDRFYVRSGSWFEAVEGQFDVIVSNPPYIRSEVVPQLDPEVRNFDPIKALDGGPDGLEAYRAIAHGVLAHFQLEGVVAVEIGYDQADQVEEIFANKGFFLLQKHSDLAKYDRILVFKRAESEVLRA
ncbi:MAG: peptide chain release factor N(5)-glutamine methyltransferase [Rhizobiaceae bacterium]|nr:peptide chain release factor N(5)-glutamine methyltransferase [Rhizobiaceae bacterium]